MDMYKFPTTGQAVMDLQSTVPGLKVVARDFSLNIDEIHLRYECPCGEVSQFIISVDRRTPNAECVVDLAKKMLRKHVLGEGFTPDF